MSIAVIIAASGSGQRLGGDKPKQFQPLGGKPVLAHSIRAFERLDIIDEIIIAAPAEFVTYTWDIAAQYGFLKVRKIVPGGANRARSVYAALQQLTDTRIVLIHDGVRPFISEEIIKSVAHAADTHGAAVAGIPLTDTIKEVNETFQVVQTLDRQRFWRVQTPQGFTYDIIKKAYAQGEKEGILDSATDDSMLVERLGIAVQMAEGHPGNIKITTREDLLLGEILLRSYR